ncbi:hypothetical protein BHM03_00039352, partial [Ensete ventricosum]
RAKMKATVKGRYEVDKSVATATLAVHAGDARLKTSFTDATFSSGPSLEGLVLSVEKPGAFILDYNVPNKATTLIPSSSSSPSDDLRSPFLEPIDWIFFSANRTALDGSLVFDPANKVSISYAFGSGNCKVKYWYAHGELRRLVLEPCYDVSKNAWDFALTRKFEGGDSLKATYQTTTKNLGLEWNRDSKDSSFKDNHSDRKA